MKRKFDEKIHISSDKRPYLLISKKRTANRQLYNCYKKIILYGNIIKNEMYYRDDGIV